MSETTDPPEEDLPLGRAEPTPREPERRPQTAVEEEFDELDVDAPLVGIIMGSKSDMDVDAEGRRRSSTSAASATRSA